MVDTEAMPRVRVAGRSSGARARKPVTTLAADGQSELLARVPAVIYIAEAGGEARWRYVSPQVQQILGYTPREWCSDPKLWAERLHAADREWVLVEEELHRHGVGEPKPIEYRMLHRDGRVVWIRDDAALVNHNGTMLWHGVLSDVTERKQVEHELELRAAQQAAVARLGEYALEGATTTELMQLAVNTATELLAVELGAVLELTPEHDGFLLRSSVGPPDTVPRTDVALIPTVSQAGYAIEAGDAVIVTDWDAERRFPQSWLVRQARARSGVAVVIDGRTGPFGVFSVQSVRPRGYSAGDVGFLQSLANVLADAFDRQATEDEIRHRALHDPLTGLPNRVLFGDRLEQALARLRRRHELTAILFLDVDNFKLVNDSLGHQLGDELLTAVAVRLRQAVRPSDTVARFGGDEFGILLDDVSGEPDAIATAERIAALFAKPFVIAGRDQFVTASIGIVIAEGGESPDGVIRDADAAMYRAKERGRARYELFDEGMRERAIARLQVETDLRHALDRDELRLEYQPIVSLSSGALVGVESLLRWDHPRRGTIAPGEFIVVAEDSALIEPIGRWVLEHACRQAARWYHARPDAPPIGVSVNVSGKQLATQRLPEVVAALVDDTGLDPACLSLEITESVMIGDAETVIETLRALKRIGVRLVLDDFGTGFSSFGYITRLPLDVLKIDREYVRGLGSSSRDEAIIAAITAMSHALSLQVIGEGVETAVHESELRRLGCDLAQGYHFARPASPEKITAILREGSPWAALPPAA
jgi:diguanylate cyclase (GGDEF)-like protein/PAS domain S-box-containing protein